MGETKTMEEKFLELLEKAKQNGTQASVVLIEIEQLLHSDNEEIQELLEKAKQNGTQATTVLLEIEQVLGGEDEELLALLEKAKQNGSQAVTVLTDIVETRGVGPQPEFIFEPALPTTSSQIKVSRSDGEPLTDDNLPPSLIVKINGKIDILKISIGSSVRWKVNNESIFSMDRDKNNNPNGILINSRSNTVELIDASIPVQGDVQIFADSQCTKYANELTEPTDTVYVRINKPWGIDSGWYQQIGDDMDNSFRASSPTTEYPDDPYSFSVFIDFVANDKHSPFEPGEVVETRASDTHIVSDYDCIFSNPNS